MSNEITRVMKLAVNNPNVNAAGPLVQGMSASYLESQITAKSHPDQVNVPTTAAGTAIPIGAVASASQGAFMCTNLDANNFVSIGIQTGGVFFPLARVRPGKSATFDLEPSITPFWRADTAAVDMEMLLLQL